MDCCQGKDDPALLTQFRHNAFDSPKNAVAHSHACSHVQAGMGPQKQSTCQTVTDLGEFLIAHHVSCFIAQESKRSGSGDDGDSASGLEANKHIPGKERPFRDDGAVCPLYSLGVDRQVMFHETHCKMLCNSFLMV
jgi:hypothetical protein